MRRSPLWALSFLALALTPAPALAAKTWSTPQAFSTTRLVFGSQRGAMAPDGTALTIGMSDLNASSALQDSIDLGVRTPAGTVTHENHVVVASGSDTTYAQIAVDSSGNALAIWCESGRGLCSAIGSETVAIRAYYRPAGGAWTALADVLAPTTSYVNTSGPQPALAMRPDGTAAVIFVGTTGDLMIAKRAPGAGNFDAPVTLWTSGTDDYVDPRVAVGADGNAVIAFGLASNSGDDELKAIHAPFPNGPITGADTLETLPDPSRAQDVVVAADPTNGAAVAWLHRTTTNTYAVHYSYVSGTGAFPAAATADADTADYTVDSPTVAFDAAKRLHLAWPRYATGGGSSFRESVLPAGGGALPASAPISTSPRNAGSLGLAGLTDGSVLAVWDEGGDVGIVSALSQSPGAWSSQVTVDATGLQPSVVAGPSGGALAAYGTSGNPPSGAVSTMSVLTDPLNGGDVLGTPPASGGGNNNGGGGGGNPNPGGGGGGNTSPGGGTPPDTTAPVISTLSIAPNAFRVAAGATALSAAAKKGTKIRFTVSEASTVSLSFTRLGTGISKGGKCKAGKPGKGRKPCTLRTPAGSLTRAVRAGATTIAFSGRVGSTTLAKGRYELRAVARDAAGNASRPKVAGFKILG